MRAFGRRAGPSQADRVDAFWRWWTASGAAECGAAIDRGEPQSVVDVLTERLQDVEDGLAWELGPGSAGRHQLVVTAGGAPELRATARRWLRAAPAADAAWEYADTRQATDDLAGAVLALGEERLALGDVVVGVERAGYGLDLVVHHDLFGSLPDDARLTISFLALDAALGEEDVETWVGSVEAAVSAPSGAVPLRDVGSEVARLRAGSTDEDGAPVWVLLRGEGPDGPMVALSRVPLVSAVAPHLDQHVAVRVPFDDVTEAGFPGPGSLDALRALEDHLAERLGDSGLLVAHETAAGRRVLHFYVESTGPGADVVRGAVTGWQQGVVAVEHEADAGWGAVRHLRP